MLRNIKQVISKKSIFYILNSYYIYTKNITSYYGYKENYMARVLISMPERFLDEIDNVAAGENRSRSELIREALRTYMHKNRVRNVALANENADKLMALLD